MDSTVSIYSNDTSPMISILLSFTISYKTCPLMFLMINLCYCPKQCKDVAQSLPLGRAGRGFSFTVDETRRHFWYLSGTFRVLIVRINPNIFQCTVYLSSSVADNEVYWLFSWLSCKRGTTQGTGRLCLWFMKLLFDWRFVALTATCLTDWLVKNTQISKFKLIWKSSDNTTPILVFELEKLRKVQN